MKQSALFTEPWRVGRVGVEGVQARSSGEVAGVLRQLFSDTCEMNSMFSAARMSSPKWMELRP
jgi:hypothetical protein